MGNPNFLRSVSLAQWKIPAALMVATAMAVPAWQAYFSAPNTGALSAAPALLDLANADTLIVYAAPANADPVLRISSRDTDGNWQESELLLSNDYPIQSAKMVAAAMARETSKQ